MKRTLAARERERLADAFPSLTLDTSQVPARVTGTMWLDPELGFSIDLEVPGNYPRGIPWLWCKRAEIPWEIARHVYPNGRACLCVSSEYRKHWPPGSDLTDFLSILVRPYLVGQAYYQDHGRWPPGRERSHGVEGIIEAYRDLLTPVGAVTPQMIENFVRLLARRTDPKGHEPCPCGSGKRLRNCHRAFLLALRRAIDPDNAKEDGELLGWERERRRRPRIRRGSRRCSPRRRRSRSRSRT